MKWVINWMKDWKLVRKSQLTMEFQELAKLFSMVDKRDINYKIDGYENKTYDEICQEAWMKFWKLNNKLILTKKQMKESSNKGNIFTKFRTKQNEICRKSK